MIAIASDAALVQRITDNYAEGGPGFTKPGRSLVFGQIDRMLPDGRRAASATTTYMWL